MMAEVYVAPEVAEVRALYPYLTDVGFRASSIQDQIGAQAATLHAAHRVGDTRIRMQILSWFPSAQGRSLDDLLSQPFSEEDAHLTLCREYGFADRAQVQSFDKQHLDPDFEMALIYMLAGNVTALIAAIEETPRLVRMRSTFGHHATLLHYLGANGVESHRQCVPLNAPELAQALIAKGADPRAEAQMYGGGQTAYMLAITSAHPANAGVSEALGQVLAPKG